MGRVVVEHHWDEAAGLYRLVHAEEVPATILEEQDVEVQVGQRNVAPEEEVPVFEAIVEVRRLPVPVETSVYVDPVEVVFDGSDPRWFEADGETRRPFDEAVAKEQRDEVKAVLRDRRRAELAADTEPPARVELPGVGSAL